MNTFYISPNISEKNNTFKYRPIGGTWVAVHIEKGSYEIVEICEQIFKQIGDRKKIFYNQMGLV